LKKTIKTMETKFNATSTATTTKTTAKKATV